jgi:hypothetical protein
VPKALSLLGDRDAQLSLRVLLEETAVNRQT